jgi:hypothetical protein
MSPGPRRSVYVALAGILRTAREIIYRPLRLARQTACLGAGGFEPLHFRIGIRQDCHGGIQNLCIWESDPVHSLSRKAHI